MLHKLYLHRWYVLMIFTAGPAILGLYLPALIISDFAFYYLNIAQLLYYLLYFSKNILVFYVTERNKIIIAHSTLFQVYTSLLNQSVFPRWTFIRKRDKQNRKPAEKSELKTYL